VPEFIGNIPIPEIAVSGVFPIVPDYGYGRAQELAIAIHQFGSGDARIEQRFCLGAGARRFTVRRAFLGPTDLAALRDFLESARRWLRVVHLQRAHRRRPRDHAAHRAV
jgi:hypothetical protein